MRHWHAAYRLAICPYQSCYHDVQRRRSSHQWNRPIMSSFTSLAVTTITITITNTTTTITSSFRYCPLMCVRVLYLVQQDSNTIFTFITCVVKYHVRNRVICADVSQSA